MPAEDPLSGADADDLRRAAGGDRAAFDALIARHGGAVLRLVSAITRDAAAAEDAFQEAFLSAWRAAGSWRGDSPVRAWLLAIARHAALRQGRGRHETPTGAEALEELGVAAGWATDPPDDWERRLESRNLLAAGFAGLSPGDREVLILRDLEGFSGDAVAGMLGIELPALKSRLHRARLRFAANLRRTNHHG